MLDFKKHCFNVVAMKKFWCVLSVSFLAIVCSIPAQNASSAAVMADRRDIEERFKRLDAAVEELFAAHNSLQTRLVKFQTELRSIREELDRQKTTTPKYASQEDLQRLLHQVQEIDKKRESDMKTVVEELRKLSKVSSAARENSTKESSSSKSHSTPPKYENTFEYTIRSGDTISQIVQDLRKQGLKVTEKMILEANPGLKADRLIVGKKILIPDNKTK